MIHHDLKLFQKVTTTQGFWTILMSLVLVLGFLQSFLTPISCLKCTTKVNCIIVLQDVIFGTTRESIHRFSLSLCSNNRMISKKQFDLKKLLGLLVFSFVYKELGNFHSILTSKKLDNLKNQQLFSDL